VYLADTNVVSELTRRAPNKRVLNWVGRHEAYFHISAVTLGELQLGYSLQPAGANKDRLEKWIEDIRRTMGAHILPFDEAVAVAWGTLEATLKHRRLRLSTTDAMIAATAFHHRLILVTRDASFAHVGLETLNPWA
jgi:predicted nucleic acid-binding protein